LAGYCEADRSAIIATADKGLERHNATLKRIVQAADLDEDSTWTADLRTGQFSWTGKKGVVTSPVQVLGTRAKADGSFLWGWDHPSVPPELSRAARSVQRFGELHHSAQLTTRKLPCTPDQARMFGNLALGLDQGDFTYIGETDSASVYLVLTVIEIHPGQADNAQRTEPTAPA
jgi:hypothetical protein